MRGAYQDFGQVAGKQQGTMQCQVSLYCLRSGLILEAEY